MNTIAGGLPREQLRNRLMNQYAKKEEGLETVAEEEKETNLVEE